MIYSIENEFLKVEISGTGAELRSIVGKKTGAEYLWQGNPDFWKNRATVIFPVCGRLEGGYYTYEGKRYELPIHGFAKLAEYEVTKKAADEIALTFRSDEESKKAYPFDFSFTVTYTLDGSRIRQHYTVKNIGQGDLPFSLGGHPGFHVPFDKTEGEDFTDYFIEFPAECKARCAVLSDRCFYTGKEADFPLKDGIRLPLRHDLFDHDAIFLSGTPEIVTLRSKKNDRRVTVSFRDMTHLGFWHTAKAEAPFLCIEPWHGIPSTDGQIDDFATKNELIHLPSGKTYETEIGIEIYE